MAWRVFADWISTAEATGTTKFQPVTLTDPLVLLAARVWLVLYNNPTFTSLCLKIYSDVGGVPGDLLFTSAARLKADIFTAANACVETFFEFNAPNGVNLAAGNTYHFVIGVAGYTGDETSHLAWKKAWPDPNANAAAFTPSIENTSVAPFNLAFIGSDQ